ncbi:hypothetical protein B0H19DRAFT_109101 [Mycena capillaripes]|nr:hypothetical protein B0H19DRAFT_109101 [Mycena capillaripes]
MRHFNVYAVIRVRFFFFFLLMFDGIWDGCSLFVAPGSRHTIKCRKCKHWSHSECVRNPQTEFTCQLCLRCNVSSSGTPLRP